jgi:hypothetical protein
MPPKTAPAKYRSWPKPFQFPKEWREKGKYFRDLSAYTAPDLSGHSLWWDEDKAPSLNQKILAILPERCAIVTALLRQNGITANANAESWDQIGDWLTRVIEPNREGTRPDEDALLEDPVQFKLFRPLHYALLTDLSLLKLQQFPDMPGAPIVPFWRLRHDNWDGSQMLTAFVPVQRRVLDSHPAREITDGFHLPFVSAVFEFAVPPAMKAMGGEWVEDWIQENAPPRFLGDHFRNLAEFRTTPWEQGADPEPCVLQEE